MTTKPTEDEIEDAINQAYASATKPTEDEIEDAINRAYASEGTRWPGMTYEQGVAEALRWCSGQTELHPLSD